MEKQKCAGRVYRFGRSNACTRNGSLEHNGSMWCKTHHPPTIKANADEKAAKWAAERKQRAEIARTVNIDRDLRGKALAWMRETRPDIVAAWEVELEAKWKS